ncbi:hypothetical protein MKW94_030525 [Papaver nudicaule]|uniref:SAM domain-containing protein n=1 Tax=Papaver nudicaule TaxID=74823 RepID=A0AA41VI38_PAPNU|nr:hypothetical protein [Papaver nudicaule]
MDWFSWLSRSNLESSLVYEYGLVFADNELEEEDIYYFNHDFLQSMGINIAKHRLEIIKLAKKEKGVGKNPSVVAVTKVVSLVKKAQRCLVKYIRTMARGGDQNPAALVVMPPPRPTSTFGSRWRRAMLLKRSRTTTPSTTTANNNNVHSKRLMMLKQGRSPSLMLTHGIMSPNVATAAYPYSLSSGASPAYPYPLSTGASPSVFYDVRSEDLHQEVNDGDDDDDAYWASATNFQEIKWDSMFQGLKPT